MVVKNAFRELAIMQATKQPEVIDWLLEETPALEWMPFFPTNSGLNHVYEVLEAVTGAGVVDADSPLPSVNARTGLEQTSLGILGGEMEVGEDKAQAMGGASNVFLSRLPKILKKSGNDAETSVLYNNFRSQAIATRAANQLTGAAQHAVGAGGTGTANYSIIAVKYEQGEVSGLYDPAGFGRGVMFDMEPINGGNTYHLRGQAGVLGYGMRLKSYFGVLTANPQNTATIVNIDLDLDDGEFKALPTAMMIDDMIDAVRGTGGNTMLYCHPRVISALSNTYKLERLQMQSEERNFDTQINAWNGIPLIGTYNMKRGTEPTVSFT